MKDNDEHAHPTPGHGPTWPWGAVKDELERQSAESAVGDGEKLYSPIILLPSPIGVIRRALEEMGTLKLYYGATDDVVRTARSALTALDEVEADREHDRHREPELQDAREWLDAIGKVTAAADEFERERDEARAELAELKRNATVANLQQMLAAVRATDALDPGDDWVTAIPEALAELDKIRVDPPADLTRTIAGIDLALRECVEDSSPYVEVEEEKLEAWKNALTSHSCATAPTEEEDYTSEELKGNPPEYWVCKIGPTTRGHLLDGADSPMRRSISAAFLSVAGHEPGVCISGWGNKLLMSEKEALGQDEPVVPRLAAPLGEWQLEAMERALECVEAAGKESIASALSRIIAGQRRRAK